MKSRSRSSAISCLLLRLYAPRIGNEPVPFLDEIEIDGRVLLFTLGVAVLTGILFGLAPAWSAAKVNLMDTLKEASRGGSGSRAPPSPCAEAG